MRWAVLSLHGKRIDLIHVIADSSAAREKMLQAHKDHQLPLNNNKKKERKNHGVQLNDSSDIKEALG